MTEPKQPTTPPRERLTHLVQRAFDSVTRADGEAEHEQEELARVAILALAHELGDLDDLRRQIAAHGEGILWNTQVIASPDPVEDAQLLIHHDCGTEVAKIEPGDPLAVLVSLAVHHRCS